jgi:biotin operon repressor
MTMPTTPSLQLDPIEAEQALLGKLLTEPTALVAARALRPADFSRDAHAIIFATLRQLDEDGLPLTAPTLTRRLDVTGQLARAGGSDYIASLVPTVPAPNNAHYYAALILQAAADDQGAAPASAAHPTGAQAGEPLARRAPEPPDDLSPEEARAQLAVLVPGLQTIQSLLREEMAPTRWIVPGLIPEGLTLLAAKPKLGKSWMALGLALAIASGGLALGKITVEPGPVLYLALEDSKKRLNARTRQLLQGQEPVGPFEVHTHWPRLDEGGLGQLKLWLQAEPDARLIILDTFAKIRGRSRNSATLYGEDYASLEQVQALAHQYEVGILVIHHTGKESREDPLDEVNATQGLNGVADNILVLRRERGKADATLVGDGRELNGVELHLHFDGAAGAWTITDPPEAGAKTPERTQVLRVLQASQEALSPAQIAQHLGKTSLAIRKLLLGMVRDGDVVSSSYGKYRACTESGNSSNTGNTGNSPTDEAASEAARETVPHLMKPDMSLSNGNTGNTFSNGESNNKRGRSVAALAEDVTLLHITKPDAEQPQEQVLPLLPLLPLSQEAQRNAEETTKPASPSAEAPPMPPAMRPKTGMPRIAQMEVTSLEGLAEMLHSNAFYLSEEAVVREAARLCWQTYPKYRPILLRATLAWLKLQGVPPKVEWCPWIEEVAEQLWQQQASA